MDAFDWGPLLEGGPLFIGILNLTPDSFSDGGRFQDPETALAQARLLVGSGAGMLDLGAESTRPGAEPVPPSAEWDRLDPVLRRLGELLPGLPLSVDTRHAGVAEKALGLGAAVINDVMGFSDPGMLDLAQQNSCGLVAMRSRVLDGSLWMPPYGDPDPRDAKDAVAEMLLVRKRLLDAGIERRRILLDPGFGFGTSYREDLALWEALPRLPSLLDWPRERICLGLSRKRFTAWKAGERDLPPASRDAVTAELHREAMDLGYRVFRTHAC